jgi:hypothetical protein
MLNVIMLNDILLSIIMLNAIMLNAIMLNDIMLSVIMLNDIMPNDIMLNVIMLNVVAPCCKLVSWLITVTSIPRVSPTNLQNLQRHQHKEDGAKEAAWFHQHFCRNFTGNFRLQLLR